MKDVKTNKSKSEVSNVVAADFKNGVLGESKPMWRDFIFMGGTRHDLNQLTRMLERKGFAFQCLSAHDCLCGNDMYCLAVNKHAVFTPELLTNLDRELTFMADKFKSVEYDGSEVGVKESEK